MTAAKEDLERHRQQLEGQIAKIKKSLQQWREWAADYEMLKEAVADSISPDSDSTQPPPPTLAQVRNDFRGFVISSREIDEIFDFEHGRTREQIVNVLDRRLDYVTRNMETLERQLGESEEMHARATGLEATGLENNEGFPFAEIIEDLDDEDNVVASRVQKPGELAPQMIEALKKAGVDVPEGGEGSEAGKGSVEAAPESEVQTPEPEQQPEPQPKLPEKPQSDPAKQKPEAAPKTAKKGVSFAEDTKSGHEPAVTQHSISRGARRVENIMKTATEQESISQQVPVIPDESAEDAALRRDMLRYSLDEIGPVVAQLELDDAAAEDEDEGFHDEFDDYDYDEDHGDQEDEDEDEDDESDEELEGEDGYGQSKYSVITAAHRARMLELEKRLGIKSRFTEADHSQREEEDENENNREGIGRIVVKNEGKAPKSALASARPDSSEEITSKSVRFAQSLDIASESRPSQPESGQIEEEDELFVNMVGDVVERTETKPTPRFKPKIKPSRFKQSLGNAPATESVTTAPRGPLDMPHRFLNYDRPTAPTAPTGPKGQVLSDTVVERDAPLWTLPDDALEDPNSEFLEQGVADEYHRLRRKFINRDGGFLKDDESPEQPLPEADGGPPRMSRFMAARLSKQ